MTQVDELSRLRRENEVLRVALRTLLQAATEPYVGEKIPPNLLPAVRQAVATLGGEDER